MIYFDSEHSGFGLPILELVNNPAQSYHTFFVWTQRLGYIPKVTENMEEGLEKGDIVVLINPARPFTEEEVNKALTYVQGGGKIVLLDSALNRESTANQLL